MESVFRSLNKVTHCLFFVPSLGFCILVPLSGWMLASGYNQLPQRCLHCCWQLDSLPCNCHALPGAFSPWTVFSPLSPARVIPGVHRTELGQYLPQTRAFYSGCEGATLTFWALGPPHLPFQAPVSQASPPLQARRHPSREAPEVGPTPGWGGTVAL